MDDCTTMIHALTDRLGRVLAFLLTGGQVASGKAGALLLKHLPACTIPLADKCYESDAIRRQIEVTEAAPTNRQTPTGVGSRASRP